MSSALESNGIDLAFTFAPVYWGFLVSLVLCGITVIQAYIYFPHSNDKLGLRFTAGWMLVLDLASSTLVALTVYYYLIPHYGSLLPLQSIPPELSAECLISTIIMLISQLYFVYQLYHVKRAGKGSWRMIGLIVLCAIFTFAGGIGCVSTMYIYRHGLLANRQNLFIIFFGIAKGFGALTDILATTAMCLFLTSSKTSMSQTNSVLKSLMQFVIHRGALVTLVQTLFLITFFIAPNNLSWLAFHVNVTKLYTNTFFAMLNARDHLKRKHSVKSNLTISRQGSNREHRLKGSSMESQESSEGKMYLPPMPTVTKSVFIAEV